MIVNMKSPGRYAQDFFVFEILDSGWIFRTT